MVINENSFSCFTFGFFTTTWLRESMRYQPRHEIDHIPRPISWWIFVSAAGLPTIWSTQVAFCATISGSTLSVKKKLQKQKKVDHKSSPVVSDAFCDSSELAENQSSSAEIGHYCNTPQDLVHSRFFPRNYHCIHCINTCSPQKGDRII